MPRIPPGERFNVYSHLAGLLLALAGAAWLVGRAALGGYGLQIAGASVFAAAIVLVYGASTLFHASAGAARQRWQRLDHCAIYLLIAGTYTPYALSALQGTWRWWLLVAVGAGAALGIVRELRPGAVAVPSLAFYVGLGWCAVAAAAPLAARLDRAGLAWLLAGAALYSAGTFFYRNRGGLRHAHGTWHLFVLGGTASHYISIARLMA
jgi:hemolysin III